MSSLTPEQVDSIPEWPLWSKRKMSNEIIWWTKLEGSYYELDITGSMSNPWLVLRNFLPEDYYMNLPGDTKRIYINWSTADLDEALQKQEEVSKELLNHVVLSVI